MFKLEVRTEPVGINLPIGLVWDVLVDLEKYGEWNSFSPEGRSDFNVGSAIHIVEDLGSGKMTNLSMTVYAYDPPKLVSWGTVIGAGWIFRGAREQHLEPTGETSCRYYCVEPLTGLIAPLIMLFFGNHMRRSYTKVGEELKRYAEAKHAGAQ